MVKKEEWIKWLKEAPTNGASLTTAKQDGLNYCGVEASKTMALTDWYKVKTVFWNFEIVSYDMGVPISIMAAIASRESRCGRVLKDGWGDNGNAFGIMQIDKRYHQIHGDFDPIGTVHIAHAVVILIEKFNEVKRIHPDWEGPYLLKGAIAAYNFGSKNVKTKNGVDEGTTGNDYSSDVIARAQFYQFLIEEQNL